MNKCTDRSSLLSCFIIFVCFFILTLSGQCAAYSYGDNIKDYMATGISSFEKGKLLDAQIDFENVLAMDAHHKGACLKLLDVLILRGEKAYAQQILRQVKAEHFASSSEIQDYEKKVTALAPKEKARLVSVKYPFAGSRGFQSGNSGNMNVSYQTGTSATGSSDSAALLGLDAFDNDSGSSGKKRNNSSLNSNGKSEAGDSDSAAILGLDAFDNDSGSGGKKCNNSSLNSNGKSEAGKTTPVRSASDMSPEEKFELALSLKKRASSDFNSGTAEEQKNLQKAVRLFVGAVMANPGLLSRSDEGLLDVSQKYYKQQVLREPDNPKYHLFSGFFHDIRSEYEDAKASYLKVVQLSPAGSRLQAVAESKIATVERTIKAQKEAMAAADVDGQKKAEAERLKKISEGHHPEFTEAVEYADKAKDIYGEWTKSRDDNLLDEAIAYYEGAIALDKTIPGFHYGLALVYIEKAASGESEYKTKAREALENTLANNPSDQMKHSAEKLLKSVSQ